MKLMCDSCGHEFSVTKKPLVCPRCKETSCFSEIVDRKPSNSMDKLSKNNRVDISKLQQLKDVSLDEDVRVCTNIDEFDRVLGGGTVNDSVTIITGQPGSGKSTLILEVAAAFAKNSKKVLYISSEESKTQVKKRAERILGMNKIPDDLYIVATKESGEIATYTEKVKPDVLFLDSISAFRSDNFPSPAGSITQVRAVSEVVIELCKHSDTQMAAFIIVHVTKDDELSGARSLEHDVDAVLYLDSSSDDNLRILRATKNRFGELTNGYFRMEEGGMLEIKNPSEFFITERSIETTPHGVALSVLKDGNRSVIIEIEALCSYSVSPYPQRIATCLSKKDSLSILISILERSSKEKYDKDNVFINVPGGLKLNSPATDLGLLMSLASYKKKISIDPMKVFIGEVGLTGELRKVSNCDNRVKELERLGYSTVCVPKGNISNLKDRKIKILEFNTLKDVIEHTFK